MKEFWDILIDKCLLSGTWFLQPRGYLFQSHLEHPGLLPIISHGHDSSVRARGSLAVPSPWPTFPDDWSLVGSGEVVDTDGFSSGKSLVGYQADYNGLQTDLLVRARAEGISNSLTPGDDFFIAKSDVNGMLQMFLISDSVVDRAGPYDVTLGITITGADLSATRWGTLRHSAQHGLPWRTADS